MRSVSLSMVFFSAKDHICAGHMLRSRSIAKQDQHAAFVGNHRLVVPGEQGYPRCAASAVIDQNNQFGVIIRTCTCAHTCNYN